MGLLPLQAGEKIVIKGRRLRTGVVIENNGKEVTIRVEGKLLMRKPCELERLEKETDTNV